MRDNHLNENELFDIYLSKGEKENAHIIKCDLCKENFERFVKDISNLNEDVLLSKVSSLDDSFFMRQKNGILSGIHGTRTRGRLFPRLMPMVAFSMVLLLIITVAIVGRLGNSGQSGTDTIVMNEQDIEDDALLMEIERLKEVPGIDGLEIFVDLSDEDLLKEPEEHGAVFKRKTVKA
jgi:hypothetical protein